MFIQKIERFKRKLYIKYAMPNSISFHIKEEIRTTIRMGEFLYVVHSTKFYP